MWQFWWCRIFHWMRCSHTWVGVDVQDFYLCKCGRAWKVTTDSYRRIGKAGDKDFDRVEKYAKIDPKPLRKFMAEVARDVETL